MTEMIPIRVGPPFSGKTTHCRDRWKVRQGPPWSCSCSIEDHHHRRIRSGRRPYRSDTQVHSRQDEQGRDGGGNIFDHVLLDDLLRGKRLELEWLSGEVVRRGKKLDVKTPAHEFTYAVLAPYVDGRPEGSH
ncbi:MAG: hypothetical protein GY798_07480 [Hyphomicrobiales bacterium]|nr:hypothetical protein [Hyphomicrobiales bacterium]